MTAAGFPKAFVREACVFDQPRQEPSNPRATNGSTTQAPALSLPKGGGAIRGIGEKFGANPVTGTGSMTIPIATSQGRSGFGPELSLSYDSGAGNGPFGFGWSLSLPAIVRKTDKGLPKYEDDDESDVFVLSGAEDLVPVLVQAQGEWVRESLPDRSVDGRTYRIQRYRPRIEGLFARIERWTNQGDAADTFWRSISKDNITSWYGRTSESRIADPGDPSRTFSWLLCESHDDKGNVIAYEYKPEDSEAVDLFHVHERNRTDATRSANRYLKRIRYGNRTPYFPVLRDDRPPTEIPVERLFEVVLDYGEHDTDAPSTNDAGAWQSRPDPFSAYRAGFEVRTYRLCQRVLMFHHFENEPGVGPNCLVRSTDFNYSYEEEPSDPRNPIFSFLLSTTQSGYRRRDDGSYLRQTLPRLEFEYTQPVVNEEVFEVDLNSLENLPYGLDNASYDWVDLDGEGISGVLTKQAAAWFYKRNLSPLNLPSIATGQGVMAGFGPIGTVAEQPSLAPHAGGQQFLDLAGDGRLDSVGLQGPTPGFYERTDEEGWDPFVPFPSLPVLDWNNSALRFIDLSGDGHSDVLMSEDGVFCWYPSLAEGGFGPAEVVYQPMDEESGPRLAFSDEEQSVYLADMSGDGLTDLVRIRNGEICYWPNLGYGRFGDQVIMDAAPLFDFTETFDQRRIRLADIDGSGVTDIVYIRSGHIDLYFNQSGNSWGPARSLNQFPSVDSLSALTTADLLGNGTACLVWSSPLPGDGGRQMRYIDLMGGNKPHLLVRSRNNLGAETVVHYAPSTRFYLADKLAGDPWITKLPFPVHVVERVETFDHIGRNHFVARYAYHHGYFDGPEREFRGFGMVEQTDTEEFAALASNGAFPAAENIDEASHLPPVLTRTWFHTGVHLGRDHVTNFFAGLSNERDVGEYYREPGLSDQQARDLLLEDTVLPDGLTDREEEEACRALKGSMLRQEVYALDGTVLALHPYLVTEQNFTVRRLQPMAENRHDVFFTHPREALTYHYDRNPADPRVGHSLTLEVDSFGNVLSSAAVGYGRRLADASLEPEDQVRQRQILATSSANAFTNPIDDVDSYRAPLPSEVRTFELHGLVLAPGRSRFSFDEILEAFHAAPIIAYHESPTAGTRERRLLEHTRNLYRRNDLTGSLALGQAESMALPFQTHQLAFAPEHLALVFGNRVTEEMLAVEGRYVHIEGDTAWWIPSDRIFFSPISTDTPAQELADAAEHFFVPRRFQDPFDATAFVAYDGYDLLLARTEDSLGNVATAEHDYRVLQPSLLTDPNRNRSAVAFDTLGLVAGTAVMGKLEENLGDNLGGFRPDLTQDEIDAFFADPRGPIATGLLANATARIVYDVTRFQRFGEGAPGFAATITRETHASDSPLPGGLRIQVSIGYSDGFGREIQKKAQAEPGPIEAGGQDVDRRWVASGWTIFNNKGKPVRQFEPFFDDDHAFRFGREEGVSPILFYDPIGRVVATLNPDHTWEKMLFTPWRQETWDANDTVTFIDPAQDPDVGAHFDRLAVEDYLPTWHDRRVDGGLGAAERDAAQKAAAHAATPGVLHLDSLGRPFLSIADNGTGGSFRTLTEQDIEGAPIRIVDDRGNAVMVYRVALDGPNDPLAQVSGYDVAGRQLYELSMDGGERRTLANIADKPIRSWDSRGHTIRTSYDALQRPIRLIVQTSDGTVLAERNVYGESHPDAESLNLRGHAHLQYDATGVTTNVHFDFKGNLLESTRRLAFEYRQTVDWSPISELEAIEEIEAAASPLLEDEAFTSSTQYDALDRPIRLRTPDNSETLPLFNEAGLLERMDVRLREDAEATSFITDIDYSAKGQREVISYATRDGLGVTTEYTYDPDTFRLRRMLTLRASDNRRLQDLSYTYDPVGNITTIRDDAQQTAFFSNSQVEPHCDYTYDALYRLIRAEGREHAAQHILQRDAEDVVPMIGIPFPNSPEALQRYVEEYAYDGVGNILTMRHIGGEVERWTRRYLYADDSNRLLATSLPGDPASGPFSALYSYDPHGNMTRMPHLPLMQWDFKDQLQASSRQVVNGGSPETTYYAYNGAGERVRKVTERQAASGQTPTRMRERIYLGAFERYREFDGGGTTVTLERETLHVMDDQQRIALVESRTEGVDGSPAQLIRYQFDNHLRSAAVETDDNASVISYEEFHPYGTSAFQSGSNLTEVRLKRYRFTGQERDEETGLAHHRARYFSPWIGRWTAADSLGIQDGVNLYAYSRNSPLAFADPTGNFAEDPRTVWDDLVDFILDPFGEAAEDVGTSIEKLSGTPKVGEDQTDPFVMMDRFDRQVEGALELHTSVAKGAAASAYILAAEGADMETFGALSALAEGTSFEPVFNNPSSATAQFGVALLYVAGSLASASRNLRGSIGVTTKSGPRLATNRAVSPGGAVGGGLVPKSAGSAVASPTTLYKPTQSAKRFDMAKAEEYAEMMRNGTWDWSKSKIIVDKFGNIVSGHHRVLAAELANVHIPESAIYRLNTETVRPLYDWADILPP